MGDPLNKPAETERTASVPEAGDAASPAESAPEAGTTQAEHRVDTLEREVSTLKDQLLRALAEAENIRRRAQREREDLSKYAISNFAKELVSVADNLRRALEAVPAEARGANDMLNTLITGIEATERQLTAAFDRVGVKRMEPLGEPFDPNFHQVMFEVENTGRSAGTVVQTLQAGYTIHGRLLREAMVGVAKRGNDEAAQQHVNTTA